MVKSSLVFAAVLMGSVFSVAGLASYPLVFPAARNTPSEALSLGGYVVIDAYHSDGTLFASWQGHNALYAQGINGLAQCLSGHASSPILGSCTGVSANVFVQDSTFHESRAAANSTLYPGGCDPFANPGTCTGWQAKGAIVFTSGTYPASITRAGTEAGNLATFDYVGISPITVNMGDYLTVTVTFTVS